MHEKTMREKTNRKNIFDFEAIENFQDSMRWKICRNFRAMRNFQDSVR